MAFKDGKRVTDKKKGSYIGSAKTRRAIYAARKPSNTYTTVKTKDSRKPSASHTNVIKQSNTTAKNFNQKKGSSNTTRLSNTRTKGDITITRIPFIKDTQKRVIPNTDSDKRFNMIGGNDRVDRKRGLMSLGTYKTQYKKGLNSLSKDKNIEQGDRITPLTLLLSAGQGVVNLIKGTKGKSQVQEDIQNIYNTHKFGYIKKK